jgi:hypothetical protein
MKKIISLVIACILLLSLSACSSEPALVGTVPVGNSSATEPPATEGEKLFKLGDSVELDGVVVNFIDVVTSTGSQFNKPTEGNVFVLCEFEIANNSQEELSVSSMLNFEAYCDEYACDTSFGALLEKGNKDQLDGTVAPGKKMKGVVGYEVPTDWKELEVHYTLDILDDSKIVFVAENS